MPNTAIAIQESMTCLSTDDANASALPAVKKMFDALGKTLVIDETLMVPATALCACGIAFFLRASSCGFPRRHRNRLPCRRGAPDGCANREWAPRRLLVQAGNHPESEVDKVTTPQGCTISGLNQMEHHGFSSALIKGITTSAAKAAVLYSPKPLER